MRGHSFDRETSHTMKVTTAVYMGSDHIFIPRLVKEGRGRKHAVSRTNALTEAITVHAEGPGGAVPMKYRLWRR